jgi:hypothetical protein
MKNIQTTFVIFILSLAILASPAFADPKTDDAVNAAEAWLKLVDSGQYKASWSEAAIFFRERVKAEDWVKMVELVRKPFGNVEERKLLTASYVTSLPGAPDGEYVVIQFQTTFSNKKNSVETITPMKNTDGKWRVSGYYVK